MSENQRYADAASSILLHKGAVQADAQRQNGAIWGQAIGQLGQIGSQGVTQIAAEHKAAQITDIFKKYGTDYDGAINEITQIDPVKGAEYAKRYTELRKNVAEAKTHEWEFATKRLGLVNNMLATVTDQPSLDQAILTLQAIDPASIKTIDRTFSQANVERWRATVRTEAQRLEQEKPQLPAPFTLGEGQKRFNPDGTEIAANPKPAPVPSDYTLGTERRSGATNEVIATGPPSTASGFSLSPGGARYDAQGNVIATRPAAPSGGGAEDRQLVAIVGPDGKPVLVKRSDAEGHAPASAASGGGKPATGAQQKTLGFFNRAKQAADDLESVETAIASKGLLGQAWMDALPNAAQGQAAQTYQQAQRAFTEARLRKDSGAAIPEQEFTNDRKTYFVQPGDTPATLAQKKRARSAMLASMAFEAGGALHGFYGDDADGMIEGYRQAAKAGGAAPAAPAAAPSGTKAAAKIGDTVTYGSKRYKVTGIKAGGQLEVEVIP